MSNFDKENYIVNQLRNMPDYEMTDTQKSEIMEGISQNITKKQRNEWWKEKLINISVITSVIAVLLLGGVTLKFSKTNLDSSTSSDSLERYDGELTRVFDLLDKNGDVVYKDGVRGIKGKIGFLNPVEGFVAEDKRNVSKLMWYAWGNEELVGKTLIAKATHQQTKKSFILDEVELSSSLYGEDAHALTQFKPFPQKGIWNIDIQIGEQSYGQIIVYVKAPYVNTKNVTYLISNEDIIQGKNLEIPIEIEKELEHANLEVTMRNLQTDEIDTYVFERTSGFVGSTMYQGEVQFDKSGLWEFEVMEEKVKVEVKKE